MPRSDEVSEPVLTVLQLGLDDWVSLGDLDAVARCCPDGQGGGHAAVVARTVRALVGAGWARPGALTPDGFRAFDGDADAAAGALLARAAARAPGWPLRGWLENTPAGDALARSRPQAAYLTRPARA